MKSLGYGHQRVKGEQVCNDVIVFNKLPLLVANIFVITPSPLKHTHCTKFVERLAFVGRCFDRVR
jgi:hypothetical protein